MPKTVKPSDPMDVALPSRSFRKAVDAFCKGCIHDPGGEGTWRAQVTACPSTLCPLYKVRPVSQGVKR
ncbi:MAG: hypothetical protein V3S01_06845 [Dehalococcoidia bacterium]